MAKYILRRLLYFVPTLLAIYAVAFLLMHAAPGNPFRQERDLPPEVLGRPGEPTAEPLSTLAGVSLEQAEKELIRNTLKMVAGNREQAAKILGIGERTLYRKIKEYNL